MRQLYQERPGTHWDRAEAGFALNVIVVVILWPFSTAEAEVSYFLNISFIFKTTWSKSVFLDVFSKARLNIPFPMDKRDLFLQRRFEMCNFMFRKMKDFF